MLVSLCAAEFSPLNVSAVDGSNTNVQATTFIGGQLASGTGPAVCARGLNSLDVFVQGTDHALWYTHWDGTKWSAWRSLGGGLASSPGVTSQANGKIDVFVRGTDGALWYKEYSGSSWSNWIGLDGQVASGTGPAACSWGAGRLDVFVQGTDGVLYQKTCTGSWSGWQSLGGKLTSSPAAMSPTNGVINVYGRGTDGALWQRGYNNNAWSSWSSLGGKLASNTGPAACSWGPGRLDVCVQGTDGALYHKWYNGGWSGWESLGGKLTSSPAAAAASGGNRIDVFVRGTDGALWSKSYNGGWGGWASVGGISLTETPTVYYVPQAGSTWVNQGMAGASYNAFVSTPSLLRTQSNGYSYWGDLGKDDYIYIPAGSATNNQNVASWEIGFHFAGIASGQRYQKIWDKAAGGFSIYIDTLYGPNSSLLTIYRTTTSGSTARWYIPTDTMLRVGHNYYVQISWDSSAGPGYEQYPTIWIGEAGNVPVHQMHWDETLALNGTGSWYNDAVGGANLGNMASNNGINTSAKTSWLVGGIFVYRQYNSIVDFSSGGSWQTDKLRWT